MKKLTFAGRKSLTGYVFVSPWMFGAIFFLVLPFIYSILMSFQNTPIGVDTVTQWAGFYNYKKAFVTDMEFVPKFMAVIQNMLIDTPIIVIVSLLIAIMISRDVKGKSFFRSVFFLPVLLGTGAVLEQVLGQNVAQQAMDVARGILLPTSVQEYLGADITGYIMEFFNRITMILWKSGVQIIIALAGIQGISTSLYESARIDGATEWEMFWKITLPMILPILLLNAVYTVIAFLTEKSEMMDYINRTLMTDMEYTSAMGWIYFLFILLLIAVVFLIMRPFMKRADVLS